MAYVPDYCEICSKARYPSNTKDFISNRERYGTIYLCRMCERKLIESENTFFYLKNGRAFPNVDKLEALKEKFNTARSDYNNLYSKVQKDYYEAAESVFRERDHLKSSSFISQFLKNLFNNQSIESKLIDLEKEREQIHNRVFEPYRQKLRDLDLKKCVRENSFREFKAGLSFGIPISQFRYRKDKSTLEEMEKFYECCSVKAVLLRKDPIFQGFGNVNKMAENHSNFIRRKKDYKRGNKLENYIKKMWSSRLIEKNNRRCIRCMKSEGIQLDHFWLPKNEGANFIMVHREKKYLVSNVLPLCYSCNSRKKDRDIRTYLDTINDEKMIKRIIDYQIDTTVEMNLDNRLLKIVGEWYAVYPRSITSVFEMP